MLLVSTAPVRPKNTTHLADCIIPFIISFDSFSLIYLPEYPVGISRVFHPYSEWMTVIH